MNDERLNEIRDVLVRELHPAKLLLFGSRSKGSFSFNSDYDIAIESKKLSLKEKEILREKLESVAGLHNIDLVFLKEVDPGFKEIIEDTGRVIYES